MLRRQRAPPWAQHALPLRLCSAQSPLLFAAMGHRRSSAQLRACVADLQEYFESAGSAARRGRFSTRVNVACTLSALVKELSEQEGAIAPHK